MAQPRSVDIHSAARKRKQIAQTGDMEVAATRIEMDPGADLKSAAKKTGTKAFCSELEKLEMTPRWPRQGYWSAATMRAAKAGHAVLSTACL